MICYLESIPVEEWEICSLENWHQDSYSYLLHYSYGWTSDPKPKVSVRTKTKLIENLRAKWDEIAGTELRGITSPIRFSGAKGRRLVVFSKREATPSWGIWIMLEQGDNRKSFTRFRAAVNMAINPHEVDHIDFVHQSTKYNLN